MSEVPPDHLEYLRRRPFVFGCSLIIFPPEEVEALSEYGHWLDALATGRIQPLTTEQRHFLLVNREEAEPETLCERAWVRLKGRREFENGGKLPSPPPADDYGMVEFDADRCWW
jgi:uncharacterized protein YifE (UPF0438 family)